MRTEAASTGNDYRLLAVLLLVASGLAWVALWRFGQSPYVHYLHHAHRHAPPGGGHLFASVIFVGGWTVMTVAMMLPTSIPLITLFYRVAAGRADRGLLVGIVVTGYLVAWAAFGLLAYVGAVGFRSAVAESAWLRANGWFLGSATLALAGAYQFSTLKYRCLDKCRSPLSFVVAHWSGERHVRQAMWLGVHHGVFCVGCCWTLMLLMFPFGAGNLGWMLALGVLMALEKNVPWGRTLGRSVGALLLAAAFVIALRA